MIAIIDYGLGNLGSIQNMLKVLNAKSVITSDPEVIDKCDKLILPGVGSFDAGMKNLLNLKLDQVIKNQVLEKKKPLLGICLGMQLLGRRSEEGTLPGLGLIPFDTIHFSFPDNRLKVPHMGWDLVEYKDSKLTKSFCGIQRYYFVHSYFAKCDDESNVLMTCDYGNKFVAAVYKDNVFGVQFHPEKSHDFGMRLLKNFVEEV